jgi:hypothetical protein
MRLAILAAVIALTPRAEGQYVNRALSFRGPIAYADKTLKTVFYVESDGRHLSAIAFDGRILWTRNPFVDAKLKPYRSDEPKIVGIGPSQALGLRRSPDPKATFIGIEFDSTQFGIVDSKNGDFFFMGQD